MFFFSHLPELIIDQEYDRTLELYAVANRNPDLYENCDYLCDVPIVGFIPREVWCYIKFHGLLCPRYFTVINNCDTTRKRRLAIMAFLKTVYVFELSIL